MYLKIMYVTEIYLMQKVVYIFMLYMTYHSLYFDILYVYSYCCLALGSCWLPMGEGLFYFPEKARPEKT